MDKHSLSLTSDSYGNFFLFNGNETFALGELRLSSGVKDSNGVLIYLDDLIKYYSSFHKKPVVCNVVFINGGFALKTRDGYIYLWSINLSVEKLEVLA